MSGLIGCDAALADRYDLALVDLDGVTYLGHEPIAGAAAGLKGARERGMRMVFITNNASREPESVAAQLSGLSIPTEPVDVMTAAQAAAGVLATRLAPGAKVLVVGGAGLVTAVRAAGFVVVTSADDEPAAVAQGFAPELGWAQLAEAAYAVQRGAWHVASNLDLSLPTARGIAPGNGALVAAVRAATGVTPDSAGKPAPTMYRLAVERAGADRPAGAHRGELGPGCGPRPPARATGPSRCRPARASRATPGPPARRGDRRVVDDQRSGGARHRRAPRASGRGRRRRRPGGPIALGLRRRLGGGGRRPSARRRLGPGVRRACALIGASAR
jgi:HAD superfamily hydrolase (TIGR01450 family)